MKTGKLVLGLLLAALSTFGCSATKPAPHLDVAAKDTATTAEEDWLSKQQLVTYANADGSPGLGNINTSQLMDMLRFTPGCMFPTTTATACEAYLNSSVLPWLCSARMQMAMATAQGQPVPWDSNNGGGNFSHFIIPPQSEETQEAIAESAQLSARIALQDAYNAFVTGSSQNANCASVWAQPTGDGRPLITAYTTAIASAYQLGKDAYDRAIETTVDVSDKMLASTSSTYLKASRAQVGSALSRAAAAHLLVGGDPGLAGSITDPMCVHPELAPDEKTALQLMRDAAISPGDVVSSAIALPALIDGPLVAVPPVIPAGGGSVRERLAQFYGYLELTGAGAQTVEQYFKLSAANFAAARVALKEEIVAFGRQSTALLPADPQNPSGFRRYSGTATEPRTLPPAAWSARARYKTDPTSVFQILGTGYITPGGYNTLTIRSQGLAEFVEVSHLVARSLLAVESTFPAAAIDQAMAPLALMESNKEYLGTVQISPSTSTTGFFVVNAFGFQTSDRMRVVVGEEGLRCAVEGTIDGAACTDTTTTPTAGYPCAPGSAPTLACSTLVLINGATTATSYPASPTATTTLTGARVPGVVLDPKTRLYLVRPKSTTVPETPGQFEALLGFMPSESFTPIPIVPSIEARVAQVLAPSNQHCAAPSVSCANVRMDARLPLEDELTNDNDGVESSWKHYLALATEAAADADALGQDFINSSLNATSNAAANEVHQAEQQERAEEALESVQSSCGTAVDSQKLLGLLSGTDGFTINQGTSHVACSMTAATNPCAPGYACTAGRCVVSIQEIAKSHPDDPDLKRLADCLDGSAASNADFVTLGDRNLCVTTDPNDPNTVCPAGSGACPAPKTGATCPTGQKEALPLGYFQYPTAAPQGSCDDIRTIRTYGANDQRAKDAFTHLYNTGIFQAERIKHNVDHLDWKGTYGAFSTVSIDDVAKYSTGSFASGPANGWPCGTKPASCTATDGTPIVGLFCSYADCTGQVPATMAPRAAMNDRLMKASLIAGAMVLGAYQTDNNALSGGQTFYGRGTVSLPVTSALTCTGQTTTSFFHYANNDPIFKCDAPSSRPGHNTELFYVTANRQPTNIAWLSTGGVVTSGLLPVENDFGFTDLIPNRAFNPAVHFLVGLSTFGVIDPGPDSVTTPWLFQVLSGRRDPNNQDVVFTTSPGGSTLTADNVLDGAELLCDAESAKEGLASQRPPSISSFDDVDAAGEYLEKLADSISGHAATQLFARIPLIAMDAMRDASTTGAFPSLGGEMAEQVSTLREGFLKAREAIPRIAGDMNQFGADLRGLRALLEKADIDKQIDDVNFVSTVSDRITECASSFDILSAAASFGSQQVVKCANAMVQIALASQINTLKKESADLDQEIAKADFTGRMTQHASSLQLSAISINEAMDEIDRSLAAIDALRKSAQVQLSKAIYLASWQSQNQVEYTTAVGTLANAKQARYKAALQNAKLMASLAKRAIEQRLGIEMKNMADPLPLVAAPSTWEGSVCTLSGIDYQSLTSGNAQNFTDGFIGDYVKKLSNVVESYRIQNNFHEGQDVAVISMRDDILNVRKPCSVPSDNLLLQTVALDDAQTWVPTGCAPVTVGGVSYPVYNCITAEQNGQTPFSTVDTQLSGAVGYNLRFGDGKLCLAGSLAGPCGWASGASILQSVTLAPGNYRFSWYSKDANGTGGNRASVAQLVPPTGVAVPAMTFQSVSATQTGDWNRPYVTFKVATAGVYKIGFGVVGTPIPSVVHTVSAPMLELLPSSNPDTALRSFQKTGADGTIQLDVCQDTDGSLFRANEWRKDCVRLCDSGFSDNCTNGPLKCFHEASFGVSQSEIQNGKLFNFSGFARGNFNYRIDTVALNFVGTGIRDCSNSNLPSTCFGGAYVPYSIMHSGPFFVRNHDGGNFQAYLFDGRIEQARGLASERYITNPISQDDRGLLTDYIRKEFEGRPLDGNFTVRIWDDAAVNFEAIDDVQLVLNYSYWTRSE